MELEDLKQKWNMLDERLSKSEVYNKRVLEEVIKGKNKTTYEKLQKQGMFNFFVTLSIASVILPLLYSMGIFRDTSFYILEMVCLLGVVMVACRLTVLYRFNVMKTPTEQLCNLINYKRCYFFESVVGVPLGVLGIFATDYFEHTISSFGLFFDLLGVIAGVSCAYFGYLKHKTTMLEISQNLTELKNFGETKKQ